MRIAALYDIHGNLPALEAVLQDIRLAQVDRLLIGGDVIPGPMPQETFRCLQNIDIPIDFILGNGDREVLSLMLGEETEWYRQAQDSWRLPVRWTAQQLTSEDAARISSWPATCRQEVSGIGNVLFCHATPQSDTEGFTRQTPEERLRPVFDPFSSSLVVCGHTHVPFDRTIGKTRVVNAGSVGMPFEEPGAHWLLLGPEVTFCRTFYDNARARERILATEYPQSEDFVRSFLRY